MSSIAVTNRIRAKGIAFPQVRKIIGGHFPGERIGANRRISIGADAEMDALMKVLDAVRA